MNIEQLLDKSPEDLNLDETIQLINFMIDKLFDQSEHQKETIRMHEQTIKSHAEMLEEHREAITQMQLAYQELCLQFDVVKRASTELGGGYQASESGIVFR